VAGDRPPLANRPLRPADALRRRIRFKLLRAWMVWSTVSTPLVADGVVELVDGEHICLAPGASWPRPGCGTLRLERPATPPRGSPRLKKRLNRK
jgi:hypothetical protein